MDNVFEEPGNLGQKYLNPDRLIRGSGHIRLSCFLSCFIFLGHGDLGLGLMYELHLLSSMQCMHHHVMYTLKNTGGGTGSLKNDHFLKNLSIDQSVYLHVEKWLNSQIIDPRKPKWFFSDEVLGAMVVMDHFHRLLSAHQLVFTQSRSLHQWFNSDSE